MLHILAHVHSLQVPIPKQTDWIMEQNRQNLEKLYREKDVIALSEKYGTRAFCEHHLMGELARLESITGKLNSPVVFCHVDFRGSNILVVGEENPRLVLCDFEYSSYGARASDMACLLAEWGREMLDVSVFEMPPQEVVEKVAGFYREGMEKYRPGYCDKEENSVEQITREIKVYMAANILFFVSFMLNQTSSIIDSLPFEEKNQFVSTGTTRTHCPLIGPLHRCLQRNCTSTTGTWSGNCTSRGWPTEAEGNKLSQVFKQWLTMSYLGEMGL